VGPALYLLRTMIRLLLSFSLFNLAHADDPTPTVDCTKLITKEACDDACECELATCCCGMGCLCGHPGTACGADEVTIFEYQADFDKPYCVAQDTTGWCPITNCAPKEPYFWDHEYTCPEPPAPTPSSVDDEDSGGHGGAAAAAIIIVLAFLGATGYVFYRRSNGLSLNPCKRDADDTLGPSDVGYSHDDSNQYVAPRSSILEA